MVHKLKIHVVKYKLNVVEQGFRCNLNSNMLNFRQQLKFQFTETTNFHESVITFIAVNEEKKIKSN